MLIMYGEPERPREEGVRVSLRHEPEDLDLNLAVLPTSYIGNMNHF